MTDKCPRCGKENPAEVHTCTPLALRLAERLGNLSDCFNAFGNDFSSPLLDAAAELRRLYMLNAELVEALDQIVRDVNMGVVLGGTTMKAEAALAKAKGGSNAN